MNFNLQTTTEYESMYTKARLRSSDKNDLKRGPSYSTAIRGSVHDPATASAYSRTKLRPAYQISGQSADYSTASRGLAYGLQAYRKYHGYAYDGIWAIARALDSIIKKNGGKLDVDAVRTRELQAELKKTKFLGVTVSVLYKLYNHKLFAMIFIFNINIFKRI